MAQAKVLFGTVRNMCDRRSRHDNIISTEAIGQRRQARRVTSNERRHSEYTLIHSTTGDSSGDIWAAEYQKWKIRCVGLMDTPRLGNHQGKMAQIIYTACTISAIASNRQALGKEQISEIERQQQRRNREQRQQSRHKGKWHSTARLCHAEAHRPSPGHHSRAPLWWTVPAMVI